MATDLTNLNQLLLNDYIKTINAFVGKQIVKQVSKQKANKCSKDTFLFFEELALKIREINFHKNCYRKCPLRKTKIDF